MTLSPRERAVACFGTGAAIALPSTVDAVTATIEAAVKDEREAVLELMTDGGYDCEDWCAPQRGTLCSYCRLRAGIIARGADG